ncbi:hypothetical protein [Microbulbifer celer]|uniref:Uncharacterized protein n=1 Tax=Microbulbifer celer TaxID=435905 RepID=A0ABW3UCB9_9GAMM|nr:hypothetical protein [Microbulbifer celer]UFN59017.1 hypothetical protein LPW13_08280 [Microbulbifer celer]
MNDKNKGVRAFAGNILLVGKKSLQLALFFSAGASAQGGYLKDNFSWGYSSA